MFSSKEGGEISGATSLLLNIFCHEGLISKTAGFS